MQCACAIMSSEARTDLQYFFFSHYRINGKIFEKKIIGYKMCVLILCTTFVRNISHSGKG
jgi:hypothetical protein